MNGNVGWITGAVPNSLSVTPGKLAQHSCGARCIQSGQAQDDRERGLPQIVDLYSAHWKRSRELTFFAKAPVDYGPRTHDVLIKRGQGRWNKLNFVADAGDLSTSSASPWTESNHPDSIAIRSSW